MGLFFSRGQSGFGSRLSRGNGLLQQFCGIVPRGESAAGAQVDVDIICVAEQEFWRARGCDIAFTFDAEEFMCGLRGNGT